MNLLLTYLFIFIQKMVWEVVYDIFNRGKYVTVMHLMMNFYLFIYFYK